MSWKQLRKQSLGKKSQEWEEYPCVSINSGSIILNRKSLLTYFKGLNPFTKGINLYVDRDERKIGLEIVDKNPASLSLTIRASNGQRAKNIQDIRSIGINTKKVVKEFPDCANRVYRCLFDKESGFIVADLSSSNELK